MAMDATQIQQALEAAFLGAEIVLKDLVGDGDHWAVRIVSPLFEGKSRIQRHRMVYQALGEVVGGALHALTLETQTPAEAGADQTGGGK